MHEYVRYHAAGRMAICCVIKIVLPLLRQVICCFQHKTIAVDLYRRWSTADIKIGQVIIQGPFDISFSIGARVNQTFSDGGIGFLARCRNALFIVLKGNGWSNGESKTPGNAEKSDTTPGTTSISNSLFFGKLHDQLTIFTPDRI
jgi:hypothetical protein